VNKVDGLWEDVQIGHYVLDKTGKVWKVKDYVFTGKWVLVDRDGEERTLAAPEPTRPVTILYDPKTLIEQKLDGKEIS
jgi:hypothetical protein